MTYIFNDQQIAEIPALLDRDRLIEAFERLGADLAARGVFVELADTR